MRDIVTAAAIILGIAPATAQAADRFRCDLGDSGTVTVGIDATGERLSVTDPAGRVRPICDWFMSTVAPGSPNQSALQATIAQCRTSIDRNVAITDWPIRSGTADMSVTAVFDRRKTTFAIYGRRSRDNFTVSATCTAL